MPPIGKPKTGTIVLIHGLWMTPRSWERWSDRYTASGHRVLAPAWPGLEREVEELQRDPSSIAGAGVAIDSAPVKGVLPVPLSTLRSAWPVLGNPANKNKTVGLTARQFHHAFTNTLSHEESQAVYDRYHVPGSARVLFQGAFANFNPRATTRVDFRNNSRAPLLFIAGGADRIVPPKVNKANVRLYRKSSAITDYHEFPDRSHYTVGLDGWEDVADFALAWAVHNSQVHA
ncbi:alpha/beta hydrolase [Streptomyces mirabilis]|jgi:pimeloyl-ACP methyl ester carboxylesterase|uniref:Alpha/beta hydrolase n=1 Tax=Streptomyces mirabilis TaxID=68239 RepID=A0A1I2U1E0_9ACTN|nr:alpha/beta hydrolase [Streptomyces mirabilis]SFG70962.1 hypothetical protein SAMN02787118_126116 [Streptomyces mirabilis]